MNVNQKGVKGLLKVIEDLHEKDFYTYIPFDDHSPIDLIAVNKKGKSYRLQIKYRHKDPRKTIERYDLRASSNVNGKRVPIDRNMIDGWAIYLADSKKVVYLDKSLLENKKCFSVDPDVDYGDIEDWIVG